MVRAHLAILRSRPLSPRCIEPQVETQLEIIRVESGRMSRLGPRNSSRFGALLKSCAGRVLSSSELTSLLAAAAHAHQAISMPEQRWGGHGVSPRAGSKRASQSMRNCIGPRTPPSPPRIGRLRAAGHCQAEIRSRLLGIRAGMAAALARSIGRQPSRATQHARERGVPSRARS